MDFDAQMPTWEYAVSASLSTDKVGAVVPIQIPPPPPDDTNVKEHQSFLVRQKWSPFEVHVIRLIEISGSYFAHYMANYPHLNFLAPLDKPVFLTIACEAMEIPRGLSGEEGGEGYLVLIRMEEEDSFLILPVKKKHEKQRILGHRSALKRLKEIVNPFIRSSLHLVEHPDALALHLEFERQLSRSQYKFGVLHCPAGAKSEEDMYSSMGSSAFFDFLSLLGDVIKLKNWGNYAGELDVTHNTNGLQSLYTRFMDFEIMFHVSTLLPFNPADPQRLQRKGKIGNDIVLIVFCEEDSFTPDLLVSQMTQVLVIVRLVSTEWDGKGYYSVRVVSKKADSGGSAVGASYPSPLPNVVSPADQDFHDAFLALLINLERTALSSVPVFAEFLRQTRVLGFRKLVKSLQEKEKKEKAKETKEPRKADRRHR
jgi:hypothetical protein